MTEDGSMTTRRQVEGERRIITLIVIGLILLSLLG